MLRSFLQALFCKLPSRTVCITIVASATTNFLGAQAAPVTPASAPATHWGSTVEANGTILYGAANQRIITAGAGTSRLDPEYELRADLQGGYGDSRNQDTGVRSVIARNVRLSSAFDLHPHDRTSPFAFASAESNFQQRYHSRVAGGVGAKQTFWRPDSVVGGFVQDASVSLAVLGENTRLLDGAPASSRASAGTRVRYSLRARFRKRIGHDVRFTHVTLYQPSAKNTGRYTLDAATELAVPLRTKLQLTIAHRERLDSEAVSRGAVSGRDGQVVFGLRATF